MEPLVSILVPCYNNQKYITDNLTSIFEQTYPNIEILIGDDASKEFDKPGLIQWLNQHRTPNIKKISIFVNEENLGTVANMENLQQKSSGEFLINIAADDALYDSHTVERLYRCAQENSDAEIVFAETELWDADLAHKMSGWVTQEVIDLLDHGSPRDLFAKSSYKAVLPATYLYRRSVLPKIGKLSDTYRLIEDLPTHLRLTRQNVKMVYCKETPILKHRDGGISHGNSLNSKKSFLVYYKDLINTYPNEVEPYLNLLSKSEQKTAKQYYEDRMRAYYTIHLPAYERSVQQGGNTSICAPPAQQSMQKPDNDLRVYRSKREWVKAIAYKVVQLHTIMLFALFALLFFIAAGSVINLASTLGSVLSTIFLIGGLICTALCPFSIVIRLLLLARHIRWNK